MRLGLVYPPPDWAACVAAGGCSPGDASPSDNPLSVTVTPSGNIQSQPGNSDATQSGVPFGLSPPGAGWNWLLIALLVVGAVIVIREV